MGLSSPHRREREPRALVRGRRALKLAGLDSVADHFCNKGLQVIVRFLDVRECVQQLAKTAIVIVASMARIGDQDSL